MTRRQWLWRAVTAAFLTVLSYVVALVMDFDPDPARLALVVATATALFSVAHQSMTDMPASWQPQPRLTTRPLGQDTGTNSTMRILESHLTAAEPSPLVRDRLARLAEARMRQHHGVGLAAPEAQDLLGEETLGALRGPVRRLSKKEIARIVTRIEEL
jgi:hypothetical protein